MGAKTRIESHEPEQDIRRSVRQRVERIELLLAWDGEVRRSDLTEFFGISDQQASADISLYKNFAPDNLQYDTSAKRYVATKAFEPCFVDLSADRFLSQLRLLHENVIESDQTWFRQSPPFDVTPNLSSEIDAGLLRKVITAIRESRSIEITYQSMSAPRPARRIISPHSLAFNGRRWHARAWCAKREAFRDFVLNRISTATGTDNSQVSRVDDLEWNTFQDVTIVPHRGLTEGQKAAVIKDYGLSRGRAKKRIRQALLFYFVDFYRLDPRKFKTLSPKHLQIEIENWDDLEHLLPKDL